LLNLLIENICKAQETLVFGIDQTIERRRGTKINAKGIYRDPGLLQVKAVRRGNNRSLNGYDGNKKVKGIKRYVVTDKNGFLLAVMVTVAQVHDSKVALLLVRVLKILLSRMQSIACRGGYRGEAINQVKKCFGYILQIVIRFLQIVIRSDDKKTGFRPVHKRWVVERTFSWFDNDRRFLQKSGTTTGNIRRNGKALRYKIIIEQNLNSLLKEDF
jgi:transposase